MNGARAGSLAIFSVGLLFAAGFDGSKWRFVSRVMVPEPERLAVVPFDRELYERMRPDLADLRIIEAGAEAPYIIETASGSVEQTECDAEMLNKALVPREGVQLTLDLASCKDQPRHSRLRIATKETNFRQKVRIQTSDDNKFWAIAREDGYIFDFTQDDRKFSALTVDYPVSTSRYVRATIFGWTSAGAVTGTWAGYRIEHPAEHVIIGSITPEVIEPGRVKLDLGQSGLPYDRIQLDVDSLDFHRAAELEASDDNKTWSLVASGTIFQVSGDESLALSFPVRRDRYLRLRIFNGDSPPVHVARVHVERLKQLIKFLDPDGGEVFFYFGNPAARAPSYDLAAVLSHRKPMEVATPTVEPWKVNPDYRPPVPPRKPWTDRYPILLYVLLGTAVVAMGLVAIVFMMKVRRV